jgi:integrase
MRSIHGGLAGFERSPPSSSVSHQSRSRSAPAAHASHSKPQGRTGSVARACSEFQQAHSKNPNTVAALKSITQAIGEKDTANLSASDIQKILAGWQEKAQHTRWNYTKALGRFIAHLEAQERAPKGLAAGIPKVRQPSPREVVATDAERESLLANATPRLRFFLLLCADLGLRHRTATRINIGNYNPLLRSLSFTTKGNIHQTLPVTDEIAETIKMLAGQDTRTPIVTLLRPAKQPGHPPSANPRFAKSFDKLKAKLGIRPELHIHDLRRTAAEDVWDATKDLRLVQTQLGHKSPVTTVRYLANRLGLEQLTPVRAAVDELRRKRKERTPAP